MSLETSLVVQWLGLDLPMQGIGGSVPGQGVKIPPASWPKKKKRKDSLCNNKGKKATPMPEFLSSPLRSLPEAMMETKPPLGILLAL